MASVHKRPTGGYRVMWAAPGPGGTRQKKNKSFARASDAKAFATRVEQEVERRGISDPEKHTVERFIKR